MCIYIDMIYLGIVTHNFRTFVPELWPLINAEILFTLNILRATWHIFNQILYMHTYWQDLAWNCYTSFFENLYQSYCHLFTPKFVSAQYLVCFTEEESDHGSLSESEEEEDEEEKKSEDEVY